MLFVLHQIDPLEKYSPQYTRKIWKEVQTGVPGGTGRKKIDYGRKILVNSDKLIEQGLELEA